MTEPTIELSSQASDYQQVRIDTVTLVNAASGPAVSNTKVETGISLQFAVDGKILRILLLSPTEIAQGAWNEAIIEARITNIMRTTCVGTVPKKNKAIYLDPQSTHFSATVKRLLSMLQAATTNFARDIEGLLKLYDGLTTAGNATPPNATAFYLKAAFSNVEVLNQYRQAHNMPENLNPMLGDKARELLKRFNIETGQIPDYDPARLSAVPLPAAPASLRAAFQAEQHTLEVQLMIQSLTNGAQAGMIPPVVVDAQFRQQLAAAIGYARALQPSVYVDASSISTSLPH